MTADSLSGRASPAAALLKRFGARRRRPIVAMSRSSTALAILAHAAARLEAPFFPLDPQLPESVRAELTRQAGDALVVADGAEIEPAAILACEPGEQERYAPPAGPALMIASSGSSGLPKVAVLTGDNLAASAAASVSATPLAPGDRWLACLPLFHIGGFSILSRCAFAGADFIPSDRYDPQRVLALLGSARITHLSLTPTMLADLAALGPPPRALRHALIGGASLSEDLAREASARGWPIQPTYGMTETCSQLATLPRLPENWRTGAMGEPLPGVQIDLTSDGRLKARGAMVMQGYANPSLTPGDGLRDGWFVSNDLAHISETGELTILGRADDVISTGGKKVFPAAVEALLDGCPGLDRCAVIGRPDPVWGEIVAAAYCGSIPPESLLAWCRANIGGAYRPRAARRLDRLPLLANGKIDRNALRKLSFGTEAEAGRIGQDNLPV